MSSTWLEWVTQCKGKKIWNPSQKLRIPSLTRLFFSPSHSGMCGMRANSIINDVKWHLVTKSTREHWPIVPLEGLYFSQLWIQPLYQLSCPFSMATHGNSKVLQLGTRMDPCVTKTNLRVAVVKDGLTALFPAYWNRALLEEKCL